MKRKKIAITLLALLIAISVFNFSYAVNTVKQTQYSKSENLDNATLFNQLLSTLLEEYGGSPEYLYYSLVDIDGDSESELIFDFGGSNGSTAYKVKNGRVVELGFVDRNASYYMKDGKLYSINTELTDVQDDKIAFDIKIHEFKIADEDIMCSTIYSKEKHYISRDEIGVLWENDINEVENFKDGAIKIQFWQLNDKTGLETLTSTKLEYKYDEIDTGESLTIPTVNDVITETEAVNKVQTAVNQSTEEQKQSETGIDKLTLLAEEAAAKANTVKLTDNNVNITAENIKESTALQATTNVLTSTNIQMQRTARNIVNYDLGDAETINVKTEDVSNKVDAVRVSTSYSSATVNANTASDFTMTNRGEKTVEINFNKDTDTTVTISFPNMNENDKYYAVVDENGNPIGGKYNPATGTLEAKLSESGIYKVVNNEKDFSDIKDKSAEMQEAIKVLASKGIINGTTATTFAPDSTISRAEVTALLMRTISLLDPNANGNFADVNTSNWYCGAAGSAKEHNIINGYEDNTFRGNTVIAKDQIVAVSARTLKQQMNYKTPSDVASELSVYADANNIASWAKEDVALATMTNLVLKRTDSTFSGSDGMTRGDAAIIMQRLFNKLW